MKSIDFKLMIISVMFLLSACAIHHESTEEIDTLGTNIEVQNATMAMPFAYSENKIYYFQNKNDKYNLIEYDCSTRHNETIDVLVMKSKLYALDGILYYLTKSDSHDQTNIMAYNIDRGENYCITKLPVRFDVNDKLNYQYLIPFQNQLYFSYKGCSMLPLHNVVFDDIGKFCVYPYDNKLYYSNSDDWGIYAKDSEHTELVLPYDLIVEQYDGYGQGIVTQIIANEQLIYFIFKVPVVGEINGGIGKIFKYAGNELSTVIDDDSSQIFFEIYNNRIYYTGTNIYSNAYQNLYSCNLDGTDNQKLQDKVQCFCIFNNRIYFYKQCYKEEIGVINDESTFYECDLNGGNIDVISQ